MSFYGDTVPLYRGYLDEIIAISMPTAIVRYYSSAGFLIAADGLVLKSDDQSVLDCERQKIFDLPGLAAAFSVTGADCLGLRGKDATPRFEFAKTIRKISPSVSIRGCRNLPEYANRLGKEVAKRLREAHELHGLDLPTESRPDERGQTMVNVFIDGFVGGFPSRAVLRFYHENGRIEKAEVNGGVLEDGRPLFEGSKIIAGLFQHDSRFAEFEKPIDANMPDGLRTAAVRAQQYIRACESQAGRELDPGPCSTIGGRIRMATISRDLGFRWVKGFGLDE